MKQTIRLNEADLHRIVKESVNKVINETRKKRLCEDIDFDSYDFYRVDIHEPNSDGDVDSEYFDNEENAYAYAKEQCYNQELMADIYYFEDYWKDVESISDFEDADWQWMDCVGFVDGQMNQF